MQKDQLNLYRAWLEGWESVTDQSPPSFVTEGLQFKLDLVLPIYAHDEDAAKQQAYALGVQNARACIEPLERLW